ncbi:virulence factor MviM [Chimaeribacter coloradensis]|uniref:Virulence factor MviM n=1 Tax=Chimaeribacter coloradensis TaxID=2060068 RepID=A0A2N5EAK9_9GAMM|nr:Gfo/Idh/MocA family oxidoreductase [Chimaeribacter coloradensis]PLR39167.1 virulence factor MviM [Chimaeribacter coloradensis]
MTSVRVGVVGLGDIAQKAYLPVLGNAGGWALVGGFSPNQQKAQGICDAYRMPLFTRLDELAAQCDAVFVHSSTASHFHVVSDLLNRGVHVYVDKPLAETLEQAEHLVEIARDNGKALMVGFNRRFSPLYRQLRSEMQQPTSIRMDKHRSDSVGPHDARFTLLDDYLHVIDTALWLTGCDATLEGGSLRCNPQGQMLYAEHHFLCGDTLVTTSMHRRAGSQRERVQAICDGAVYQLDEMRHWVQEQGGLLTERPVPGWQSVLVQRGFDGAVRHFIECVSNQTAPETSGDQALYAQQVIEQLLYEGGLPE